MALESLTKASQRILSVFFEDLGKEWYVRETARKSKMPLKTVSWNLNKLTGMKILNRERKGREVWYSVKIDNELSSELYAGHEKSETRNFMDKNPGLKMGLSELLKSLETSLGDPILLITLFGSHVRGYATNKSDVDLLVCVREGGKEDYSKWKLMIDNVSDKVRARYGSVLSVSLMTLTDFRENLKNKEPFILTVLKNHFILYGSELYTKEVFSWMMTKK